MSDEAPHALRDAVDAGRARRKVTLVTSIVLIALVVVTTCVMMGVGLLLWNDRAYRARERKQQKVYEKVIADVYGSLNDANARLARIEGRPLPTPIVPPTTPTTAARPTTTVANRPASTAVRPSQPPTTTTTATTALSPSGTTTTTTAPSAPPTTCATVPYLARCVP